MSFLFSLLCFKAFSWRFLLSGIFFWFFLVERGIIHDGQREIMGYTEGFCVCVCFFSCSFSACVCSLGHSLLVM
ncbi:hypothetical protein J3E72DRAFT_321630, partial [Bipolaris maydis]|uniref:uncharacterized protein n=1 Tax=Cochliobolus heterostrophus TaxID=5016 RepID=UPI0024CF6B36